MTSERTFASETEPDFYQVDVTRRSLWQLISWPISKSQTPKSISVTPGNAGNARAVWRKIYRARRPTGGSGRRLAAKTHRHHRVSKHRAVESLVQFTGILSHHGYAP